MYVKVIAYTSQHNPEGRILLIGEKCDNLARLKSIFSSSTDLSDDPQDITSLMEIPSSGDVSVYPLIKL